MILTLTAGSMTSPIAPWWRTAGFPPPLYPPVCALHVLGGGNAVVERGPLQRVVPERVGLGDGAALALDEAVQLLEVPVRRARVHVVLERLLLPFLTRPRRDGRFRPAPGGGGGGDGRGIVDHLDLRRSHGGSGGLAARGIWSGGRGGGDAQARDLLDARSL